MLLPPSLKRPPSLERAVAACLATRISRLEESGGRFAASSVVDRGTGRVFVKLVNGRAEPRQLEIRIRGAEVLAAEATRTVIAGPDADVVNGRGDEPAVSPVVSGIRVGDRFTCEAPAHSLTVIRLEPRDQNHPAAER